jgi:hypothetical protein
MDFSLAPALAVSLIPFHGTVVAPRRYRLGTNVAFARLTPERVAQLHQSSVFALVEITLGALAGLWFSGRGIWTGTP